MKCEGQETKGITRALGLDLFTRYGAKVVFKAATLVAAGLLVMVTLSRWGPPQATSTITITNREKLPQTENGVHAKPEPLGRIDESLNRLQQDDPDLIKAVRDRLIPPPDKPFQWGSREHTDTALDGQFGQPRFVEGMLRSSLKNGFFIEAGAFDGIYASNSLLFELRHNWTGLLAEPDPENFEKLVGNHRKALLLPHCFSTKSTPEVVEYNARGTNGGIVNAEKEGKNYPGILGRRIRVQCFPLYSVLMALGNPTVHYFSLDIEGAELMVLKTLPLHKVDIKIFDIEMNHIDEVFEGGVEELKALMDQNGYEAFRNIRIDTIFVKKGFEFNREV